MHIPLEQLPLKPPNQLNLPKRLIPPAPRTFIPFELPIKAIFDPYMSHKVHLPSLQALCPFFIFPSQKLINFRPTIAISELRWEGDIYTAIFTYACVLG